MLKKHKKPGMKKMVKSSIRNRSSEFTSPDKEGYAPDRPVPTNIETNQNIGSELETPDDFNQRKAT